MFANHMSHEGPVIVCELHGELDAFTAAQVRETMAELSHSRAIVIDLHAVVFIDSAGLGALVGGIRRSRELGGDVVLCHPTGAVERVLRVAGLSRIVSVTETLEQALAELTAEAAPATA